MRDKRAKSLRTIVTYWRHLKSALSKLNACVCTVCPLVSDLVGSGIDTRRYNSAHQKLLFLDIRSIDLQVSRLRQRLGEDAKVPVLLKTVRNEGYVLATQVTLEK